MKFRLEVSVECPDSEEARRFRDRLHDVIQLEWLDWPQRYNKEVGIRVIKNETDELYGD